MGDKLIFYSLIWNSKKDFRVQMTKEKILDSEYFIDKVTLRKSKFTIHIYGKIKDNNKIIIREDIMENRFKNVPLLKSNLQKCIRRGLTDKALVTGYNLIQQDFWSFIRRLIIISIEDVSVVENIPFLSWCLVAYPNFNLTNEMIQYLLLTIYALCNFPKKIKIKKSYSSISNTIYQNVIQEPIKLGYLIRQEYGGLKGDMAMINYLLTKNIKNKYIVRIPLENLLLTRTISKLDIINPSIDFHITHKIYKYISDRSEIKNHETIKKAIWNHSSSINFREKKKKKNLEYEWNKIKELLDKFYKEFKVY